MRSRCRVCGILQPNLDRQGRCHPCQAAYQRFRKDTGWGMKTVGGFRKVGNKLVNDGPLREVPDAPSGNWFRYIVRERLLRGLSRYPFIYTAFEHKHYWHPDKMPPWEDMHIAPTDFGNIPPKQLVALGIADVFEQNFEPEGYIGPWGPPVTGPLGP